MPTSSSLIILNPGAGSADDAREVLRRRDVRVRETESEADVREAIRSFVDEGGRRVIAAGGDGTIHAVANALLTSDASGSVELGVLPCGTGNDLARTLRLPDALDDALDVALTAPAEPMDVLRLTSGGETRFCLNAAAGGFAGKVNQAVSTERKDRWGPFAFVLSAAEAIPDLEGYRTTVQLDDAPPREIEAVNVILANGRTIAGGKEVAPPADLRDGLLDVVIVHRAPLPDLAAASARLLVDDWREHDAVTHHRAARVRVESDPPMRFNADGELWTEDAIDAEVLPNRLPVASPADESR